MLPLSKKVIQTSKKRKKKLNDEEQMYREMEECVQYLEGEKKNIVEKYPEWIKVGFCYAFHFGERQRTVPLHK